MALDFKEIPNSNRGDDTFEQFCREFLVEVRKYQIFQGPSRGADGGIDIGVLREIEGAPQRWLVSCKHFSHSNESVGRSDEEDILDRVHEHGCTGFMGLYSTIPSSGLEQKLQRLRENRNLQFEIVDRRLIERELLQTGRGFEVVRRFFSKSMANLAPEVISVVPTYDVDDCERLADGTWSWKGQIYSPTLEGLLETANELAMLEIHHPMYLGAWKDAVRLFPQYFVIPQAGIDSVSDFSELPPDWSTINSLSRHRPPNERWFVFAVWSLRDASRVRSLLRKIGKDAEQIETDILSLSWLARSQRTERRDILTRLFAYNCEKNS